MADLRRVAAVVVVTATCALAGCGDKRDVPTVSQVTPLAEEVPMPQMRVGDVLEYESRARAVLGGADPPARWTLTVSRVEGDGRFHADVKGFDPIARAPFSNVVEYAGPWNTVMPAPYVGPEFLRFPLRQGAAWTSVAANPASSQTRSVTMEVKGRQSMEVAGAKVDCVLVQGSDTTTNAGPPPTTPTRLWYCPSLRAVGRMEADVPTVPVTQTLVAHRLQP